MTELPAGLRAEHTVVHPNVNGATIVWGTEPLSIEGPPVGGGQVHVVSRVEWVASVHLPPAAMKHLRDQMIAVVDDWEKMFGPIPMSVAAPPKPKLELVRQTDQPAEDLTVQMAERALQQAEQANLFVERQYAAETAAAVDRGVKPAPFFPLSQLFDSAGPQAPRHQSDEYPQAGPAPSPSEPTP